MDGTTYVGITKWFGSKGEAFGYIHGFTHPDGTPGEVFVHYKAILEDNQANPKFRVLPKGRKVTFEISTGYPSASRGSQAIRVRLLPE
jgi:cold shock CspA family protein